MRGSGHVCVSSSHLDRRRLLGTGLVAAVGAVTAGCIRPAGLAGPDLYRARYGELLTFGQHVSLGMIPGLCFRAYGSSRRIYPVAAGTVTAVGYKRHLGNYVVVRHGPFWSEYLGLDTIYVSRPAQVDRRQSLGTAGRTMWDHIFQPDDFVHIGVLSKATLQGVSSVTTPSGWIYHDPCDLSAHPAIDSRGMRTLTYWDGTETAIDPRTGISSLTAPFANPLRPDLYRT